MGWCHLWIKLQKKMIVIPILKEKLIPLIRNWRWLHAHVVTFETQVAHISYILLQFHSIVYEATLQKKQKTNKQKPLLLKMLLLLCNMHHPSQIYIMQENLTNLQFFSRPQPLKVVASYQLVMILSQLVVLLQFLLPSERHNEISNY